MATAKQPVPESYVNFFNRAVWVTLLICFGLPFFVLWFHLAPNSSLTTPLGVWLFLSYCLSFIVSVLFIQFFGHVKPVLDGSDTNQKTNMILNALVACIIIGGATAMGGWLMLQKYQFLGSSYRLLFVTVLFALSLGVWSSVISLAQV